MATMQDEKDIKECKCPTWTGWYASIPTQTVTCSIFMTSTSCLELDPLPYQNPIMKPETIHPRSQTFLLVLSLQLMKLTCTVTETAHRRFPNWFIPVTIVNSIFPAQCNGTGVQFYSFEVLSRSHEFITWWTNRQLSNNIQHIHIIFYPYRSLGQKWRWMSNIKIEKMIEVAIFS